MHYQSVSVVLIDDCHAGYVKQHVFDCIFACIVAAGCVGMIVRMLNIHGQGQFAVRQTKRAFCWGCGTAIIT